MIKSIYYKYNILFYKLINKFSYEYNSYDLIINISTNSYYFYTLIEPLDSPWRGKSNGMFIGKNWY